MTSPRMTAPENRGVVRSGHDIVVHWLALSVPPQKWEPRRPDHPKSGVNHDTHGIEPDEPSKSCPYSRKDEVARHRRRAQTDRSMRIPDLRNAHPFDQPSTKPAKSGQLAARCA